MPDPGLELELVPGSGAEAEPEGRLPYLAAPGLARKRGLSLKECNRV